MKKYKEIIIAVLIIVIVIIFQIINVNKKHNVKNLENIDINEISEVNDGKTETNEPNLVTDENGYTEEEIKLSMQTGDRYFVKLGNTAIYLNDFDSSLYVFDLQTKEYKKIEGTEHGLEKIYFDGEYIYGQPSYYREKGIYKIDLDGNREKILENSSLQLWITDDEIYFVDQIGFDQINGTPQGNLCRMNKDGSEKQTIIENVKNYFYIVGEYIYYIDQSSRSIYKANIDGTNKKEIAKGRCYITSANETCLTYLDYNDGEKHHIIYFDNDENHEVGRFGNVKVTSNGEVYFYTRKLIGKDDLEYEKTLFWVHFHENSELECWKADEVDLDFLAYVYNDYAYFSQSSNYYRVNINDKNIKENLPFGHSIFIDGKAYGAKSIDGELVEFYIYNLKDLSKEEIKIVN